MAVEIRSNGNLKGKDKWKSGPALSEPESEGHAEIATRLFFWRLGSRVRFAALRHRPARAYRFRWDASSLPYSAPRRWIYELDKLSHK